MLNSKLDINFILSLLLIALSLNFPSLIAVMFAMLPFTSSLAIFEGIPFSSTISQIISDLEFSG